VTVYSHLQVGKIRSSSRNAYPSEAAYVQQIREQLRDFEQIINKVLKQLVDEAAPIMLDALQPTKEKAEYYCPKKTGALVESSYLEITSFRGNPRVELGFAKGGEPPYAVYVHEMVEYHHAPPTRSKFLQAAVYEDLDNIFNRIAESYKSFMES
jgi:hypothetical protein